MDYHDPLEVPISDTTSPSIVIVALAKWIDTMNTLDAHSNEGHREVLSVLLRLVKVWAEDLRDNPSYEELGNQLIDQVVEAIGYRNEQSRS
tara:strand:- start:611 stop:883 length:273 start_codon:yes stop_codon:yes gene_type:complete